jgi:hypothetical protein
MIKNHKEVRSWKKAVMTQFKILFLQLVVCADCGKP